MLDLVVQSLEMLQGKDLTDDHKGHDLDQENDDGITLERDHHVTKIGDIVHQVDIAQVQKKDEEIDHVREDVADQETDQTKGDEVDQGKESIVNANTIFLIIVTKINCIRFIYNMYYHVLVSIVMVSYLIEIRKGEVLYVYIQQIIHHHFSVFMLLW